MRRPGTRTVLLSAAALVAAIQLVPIDRSNPPARADPPAPQPVATLLRRACYDCHSNETRWPWYDYIAPGSWLVRHDIQSGRRHLNFSEWPSYPAATRQKKLRDISEQVSHGEMPLWYYTPLHPDARLTPAEARAIVDWAGSR